jgi:NADPH:quinone reductase-like Zn-dependent oxidoreductase
MDEQRLILNEVSKLIDSGKVRTTLGLDLGDMNISNIKKAHELLKSGKAIGKLVMGELKN